MWGLGYLIAAFLHAQDPVMPADALLLARIKVRAGENLQRLPNYTCLQTIERSRRRTSSRKFELADVIRLEVALVNQKELFAWPGSDRFDERDITDMVSGGAIGNGTFAIHLKSIFLSQSPSFQYVGERFREGRRTVRYDFQVPMFLSGYKLRVPPAEGVVGYKGSFWVDAETLDIIWIEIKDTEIPPHLPVRSAELFMSYAKAKIGEQDFVLPQSAEMIFTDLQGNESRNRTYFSNCRQYAGESTLSFGDAPTETAVRKAPESVILPEGLELELKLDTVIDTEGSAVGDAVKATVVRDAKIKRGTIVPKGAAVTGRLLRLERRTRQHEVYWIAGIEFTRVEFDGKYAGLRARMEPQETPFQFHGARQGYQPDPEPPAANPRIGILYIKGEHGKLSPGFRTWWQTESSKEDKQ